LNLRLFSLEYRLFGGYAFNPFSFRIGEKPQKIRSEAFSEILVRQSSIERNDYIDRHRVSHATEQSVRGLAHSTTLREVRRSSFHAPASWSAVAPYRFSPLYQ
jgi:hypothetical protein